MSLESDQIMAFLKELDAQCDFKKPVDLHLVGGAAITLFYDHQNRTADLDFVDPPTSLVKKGGQDSPLAKKYKVYVSLLPAISFSVPSDWKMRCHPLPAKFKNFNILIASIEDIVLGKIARLEPKDFEDVVGLYERKTLNPKRLLLRLKDNKKELQEFGYRNNCKLLFREVFGLHLTFEKGGPKLAGR